ncbi:MAG TPA: hypothetical protein VJ770_10365 [Stellaceae bacterium]|nr:hypothetical protein [Stellaceae bacterium]
MPLCKLMLAAAAAIVIGSGAANAQQANPQNSVNGALAQSLGSINECYHGMHSPSPCTKNVYVISGLIYGSWKAEGKPWILKFSPNSISNFTSGTISMATIGPAKTGKYRISDDVSDSDYAIITIDMDNGQHFRSRIAMLGARKLIIVDGDESTTFDR